MAGWTIVLDIGKTLSKASLWDDGSAVVERRSRPNEPQRGGAYQELDSLGIETWVEHVLREFGGRGPVDLIVPVAHGAAAALLLDESLACPVMDYEWHPREAESPDYDRERDPFAVTGSPALPAGLNLGRQLRRLDDLGVPRSSTIVPWPQYWAWRLSGIMASELTSLGCHTDLWLPYERAPSRLAVRSGWAGRLAPLRPAGSVLGTLTSEWQRRTGLDAHIAVACGLHDSNAALAAGRSAPGLHGRDVTVLSTGTWFIAMRTPASGPAHASTAGLTGPCLPEGRDCLLNVDASGAAVPSARFMGGRELELLGGTAGVSPLPASAVRAIDCGAMFLPGALPGIGPYPKSARATCHGAGEGIEPMALAQVYAALVADTALELIGSRDTVLVEGRFAHEPVFVRTLRGARPDLRVLVGDGQDGVARGALGLVGRPVPPPQLTPIEPLAADLSAYRRRWRELAQPAAP